MSVETQQLKRRGKSNLKGQSPDKVSQKVMNLVGRGLVEKPEGEKPARINDLILAANSG